MNRTLLALVCVASSAAGAPENPSARQCELKTVDGNVEVFVDGERQLRMWGRLALPGQNAPEKLEQYLDAGIDIYLTNVDLEWNMVGMGTKAMISELTRCISIGFSQ